MGKLGEDYGSERHLLTYRKSAPEALDRAILHALSSDAGTTVRWLYPDRSGRRGVKFKGVGFLRSQPWATGTPKALADWTGFWPQTGSAPSWDGVVILERNGVPNQWLLLEAKGNHPEFVGTPARATRKSLEIIERALNRTKRGCGVHRHFHWTGSYYQFANRLALTAFLNRHGVPATLVEVFFTGDRFPDGRFCPASEGEWKPLIEARRVTLGLGPLTVPDHVVDVFLSCHNPMD